MKLKKLYRKSFKIARNQFQQKSLDKLTDLARNPKEFWRYASKLMGKGKQTNDCNVPDDIWVEHFTNLNSNDPSNSFRQPTGEKS